MKKKVITVILAAMMALSLAACGNVNADAGDDGTQVMANLDENTVSNEKSESEHNSEAEDPDSTEASAESAEEPEETAQPEETEAPDMSEATDEETNDEVAEPAETEAPAATETPKQDTSTTTANTTDKKTDDAATKAEADRLAAEKAAQEAAAKAEADRLTAEAAAKAEADRIAAEEAARQPAPTQQPAQSNSTAQVTDTTPVIPEATPAPTPTHEHVWTPIYETRTTTVVVQEEWFEPEYLDIPIVETHLICDQCGMDFGTDPIASVAAAYNHITIDNSGCASSTYHDITVRIDHVLAGSSIWHPAVTEERTEQVIVGYTCECGATK